MKKILFRVSALLMGIGFILISLELFLRITPKFRYRYNSAKFMATETPILKKINDDDTIRSSALFGYEYVPNSRYRGINSFGLIGKEYKLERDKGTYRILLLGDSIAEQGWSAKFLEESLNNNSFLNSKYKFEIWNAGVGGYDVRRYYLYLKYKGLNYKPDMVMIFLFMNDFRLDINVYYKTKDGAIAYYFPLRGISRRYTVSPFLMKHSYLYRFLILRLDSYFYLGKKNKRGMEKDGRYYLGMIKDICEKNNLPLFVVIFPYLKPLNEYHNHQMNEYKTIFKVIKDLKINYLNLYEHLTEKNLFNLRDKQEDEIHLSLEGQRLNAQIIYNYMLDNFFRAN